MLKKFFKNLEKFSNLEIRDKVRVIEKLAHIKIYPHYLKNNFFDKLRYNFFFLL